jgi:hypothetical protein
MDRLGRVRLVHHKVDPYQALEAFFNFLISFVAHWLRVLVLEALDLRPWVSSSVMGSTSTRPNMLAPKAEHRSLEERETRNQIRFK